MVVTVEQKDAKAGEEENLRNGCVEPGHEEEARFRFNGTKEAKRADEDVEQTVEDEQGGKDVHVPAAELEEGRKESVRLAAAEDPDAVEDEDDMSEKSLSF